MVDYAHDDHRFVLDHVEYSVSAMDKASYAGAKFGLPYADIRMGSQAIESLVEAQKIGVGHFRPELFKAVQTDIDKIVPRPGADIQFSHDQRGIGSRFAAGRLWDFR